MTTATAPIADRERLEIIWCTATRDVQRFTNEADISGVNSKRWRKVDDALMELGAMLVAEVSDHLRPDGTTEVSDLVSVTEDIWRYIEERLIDWALDIEGLRAERQAGTAA